MTCSVTVFKAEIVALVSLKVPSGPPLDPQISARRDPAQPATIQKILRETTREDILPRQSITLDDIFRDSASHGNVFTSNKIRTEEEKEAPTKEEEEEVGRRKMDLDKQPRLVDRRDFVPALRIAAA